MKRLMINIVLFTMNTLSFAGDGTEGAGSYAETDDTTNDEAFAAAASASVEATDEIVVEGEVTEIPSYPFDSKLEAAINAALGDNEIDNPGAIVTQEFCGLLYRSGIGPDVFAPLGQTENAMAAQTN